MDDLEAIAAQAAEMRAEAERLQKRAVVLEDQASELEEALHVIRKFMARRPPQGVADEHDDADMEADFRSGPEIQKLTRKDMVRAVAPTSRDSAMGPKELTDAVNERFGANYKPNHIRPIIWRMANEEDEAESEDGKYWLKQKAMNSPE